MDDSAELEPMTKERLLADFRTVVADAEELLKATAAQTGERISAARSRVEASLQDAREKLADMERGVVDRTREAARATDHYVHEHPWQSVGVAASIGLLLGLLIGRR
ncbi:MAG: DUF883 family protein [Betaproteobacteria bacterium]|nr:DUF883 family protein [Betaproteobacteria bacterium]